MESKPNDSGQASFEMETGIHRMTFFKNLYQLVRKVVFLFVKYRIHLSLIFYFLLTYNNLRVTENLNLSLILSFSVWHFALFLFDRIYDRHIDRLAQPDEYVPENQAKFLYTLVGLLILGSLLFYLQTDYPIKFWLLLLPITFLYPLEIFGKKRVKSFLLIKNVYSALLIYSLPIYIQAYLLNNQTPPDSSVITPIYSLFAYVMIGEIFWDIRDTSVDKANGTSTLPNVLGLIPTKLILVGIILTDMMFRMSNLSSSGMIYLVLLSFVKEKTDRLVFHLPPLIALLRFLT